MTWSPCSAPGCHRLTTSFGRCPTCRARMERARGSAFERGYRSAGQWGKFRAQYLNAHPWCGDRSPDAPVTRDSLCVEAGRHTAATDVDHIRPVMGPHDPTFFDWRAVQALCHACHSAKTRREQGRVVA